MTDPSRYERRECVPRWLKVAGLVLVLVVLVVVVFRLVTGGGDHGPRRHGLAGEPAVQIASTR